MSEKYEHTPRPNIEHHHHIRDLIEAQEKRAEDRTRYRDREKQREERGDIIRDSKMVMMQHFWCARCQEDFVQLTYRQIEKDWTNPSQHIAFYKAKHDCGAWTMRFITDRHKDPYWYESAKVRADQGKHFRDTIQPFQTGYNLLYKKK